METLHYTIQINVPREKVWHAMLDKPTYDQWTKPFNADSPHADSTFRGSWDKGSEIEFIGTNEEGTEDGMLARVKENRPNEFVSLEHFGIITKGVRDTTSDEVKKWTPAFENYTSKEKDGGTELIVDVDVAEEYKGMFEEMWPKALELLKEIAEK